MDAVERILAAGVPSCRDGHDVVAFALHAAMVAQGFRCEGTTDAASTPADAVSTPKAYAMNSVPEAWNSSSDTYTFRYTLPNLSDKSVVVKMVRMENALMVHALLSPSGKLHSLDIRVDDYTQEPSSSSPPAVRDLAGLVAVFDERIRSHLLPRPDLSKQREQRQREEEHRRERNERGREGDFRGHDPLRVDPSRPVPWVPTYHPSPLAIGGPRGYGDHDLRPFGPGSVAPGLGRGGGGGNLMGPGNFPFPAGRGGRPGARPGAGQPRFDPFGPGRGGGIGEPDPDDLRMPGGFGGDNFFM